MSWIRELKVEGMHGARVTITAPDGSESTILFVHRRRGKRLRLFVDTPGCKVEYKKPVEGEDLYEYARRNR